MIAGAVEEAVEKTAAKARQEVAAARAEAIAAEQHILRRLIEKRFGALSEATAARIGSMSLAEIEDVSLRLLDVASLDELF